MTLTQTVPSQWKHHALPQQLYSLTQTLLRGIKEQTNLAARGLLNHYQACMQTRQADLQLNALVNQEQKSLLAGALSQLPSFKSSDAHPILKILVLTKALQHKPFFKTQDEAQDWLSRITQTHYLRPKHLEREDLKTKYSIEKNRLGLIQALNEIDQFDACAPQSKQYDHLWILGADENNMKKRFDAAASDLNHHKITIQDNCLYVRTGERPLWPFVAYQKQTAQKSSEHMSTGEAAALDLLVKYNLIPRQWLSQLFHQHLTPDILQSHNSGAIKKARQDIMTAVEARYPKAHWPTEADLARELFNMKKLESESFDKLTLKIVSAGMNPDGSRPTTEDVERQAQLPYSENHTPKVLVYSNQPHIMRQELVLTKAQPHVEFETCGAGEEEDFNISVNLDELARRTYQSLENKRSQMKPDA